MIDYKEIAEGKHNNKIVWICDLRYNDYTQKPIRHIKPTKVLIRDNSQTTKNIYYSASHFVGLNKKGEPIKSKVISLFDNTGFRSRTGTPLDCFETEAECIEGYKKLCVTAIKGLNAFKEDFISGINAKINEYQNF